MTGIGIALGVVVGVLLLTVAVACYRRSSFDLRRCVCMPIVLFCHRQQRASLQRQMERERQPLQGKKYDVPPPLLHSPPELPNPALYAEYSVPSTLRPITAQSISTGPGVPDPNQGYEQNFQLIKLRSDDEDFTIIPENGTETIQLKSRKNLSPPIEKKVGHKHLAYLESDDHVYEIPE